MTDSCNIIPCFKEANKIDVEAYKTFQEQNNAFDLQFVNDSSLVKTKSVLNNIKVKLLNTSDLHLEKNSGKAEAIRQTVLQQDQKYNYDGYLNTNLLTPLSQILRLLNIVKTKNKTIVLGFRVKVLRASIKRKIYRPFFGRLVARFMYSLRLEICDTRCGSKLINRELAALIFKDHLKTRWLFDVELLARTKNQYGKNYCFINILEHPLNQ